MNSRGARAYVRYRSRVWLRVARRANVSVRCRSTPTPAPVAFTVVDRRRPVSGVVRGARRNTTPRRMAFSCASARRAARRPGSLTATTTSVEGYRRTATPTARVDRLATRRPATERRRRDNPSAVRGVRRDRRRSIAQLPRDPDALGAWAMASRDRAPTRRPDHTPAMGRLHARLSP
jgi:hypothetical protein